MTLITNKIPSKEVLDGKCFKIWVFTVRQNCEIRFLNSGNKVATLNRTCVECMTLKVDYCRTYCNSIVSRSPLAPWQNTKMSSWIFVLILSLNLSVSDPVPNEIQILVSAFTSGLRFVYSLICEKLLGIP